MRFSNLRNPFFHLFLVLLLLAAARSSATEKIGRISGPFTHDNLSIYLLHGASEPGKVPLTLEEAIDKGAARVVETGDVNELAIENLSDEEVFIQAGDIVKGGQQDRVLAFSTILKPHSGSVPIGSFCVEAGRWAQRGEESRATFTSSTRSVPSREMKLAVISSTVTREPNYGFITEDADRNPDSASGATIGLEPQLNRVLGYSAQQQVWQKVAETQRKLSQNVGATVAAAPSPSSLQLALENTALRERETAYFDALTNLADKDDDVIGYAFAVNGRFNSADIYPSNGLFRKMWQKQLRASITEAIAEKHEEKTAEPPSSDAMRTLLATEAQHRAARSEAALGVNIEQKDAGDAVLFAASRADGRVIHSNFIAKK